MRLELFIAHTLIILTIIWFIILIILYRKKVYEMVVGEDRVLQWSESILFMSVTFYAVSFFCGILGMEVPATIYATIDITLATGLTGSIYTKKNTNNGTDK